jgi:hypothetical protein
VLDDDRGLGLEVADPVLGDDRGERFHRQVVTHGLAGDGQVPALAVAEAQHRVEGARLLGPGDDLLALVVGQGLEVDLLVRGIHADEGVEQERGVEPAVQLVGQGAEVAHRGADVGASQVELRGVGGRQLSGRGGRAAAL